MASGLTLCRPFGLLPRTFSRTFSQNFISDCISESIRVPSLIICRKCSSDSSKQVKAPGLGEHQHHPPRHENWARDLIYSLDAGQRKKLMDELAVFEKAKVRRLQECLRSHDGLFQADGSPELYEPAFEKDQKEPIAVQKLTISQKRQLAIFCGLPFVGFGTLDNIVMITAGEYIDNTFGAILGISTMAAAALGNMVSDIAGIGTAGYVEEMASKVGILPPDLTPEQVDLKSTRRMSSLGRMVGVAIGCTIGMMPLLLINRDEDEKGEESSETVNTTTNSGQEKTKK